MEKRDVRAHLSVLAKCVSVWPLKAAYIAELKKNATPSDAAVLMEYESCSQSPFDDGCLQRILGKPHYDYYDSPRLLACSLMWHYQANVVELTGLRPVNWRQFVRN